MGLYFKSLCSSSSGNSVTLWTQSSRVVFDCGFGSMKRCRQAFSEHMDDGGRGASGGTGDTGDTGGRGGGDANVIISHAHSDHVGYYPLRAIEQIGAPVWVHQGSVEQLRAKHFNGYGFANLDMRTFDGGTFQVDDFTIEPIEIQHNPVFRTFGFVVRTEAAGRLRKVVIATDFCRWDDIAEHFVDADFIFVEANHDLGLLKKYYNPNSKFHMSNPETARLLCHVRAASGRGPRGVMLGHISPQRNNAALALAETKRAFDAAGLEMDFDLSAAPLCEASETIRIA